MQGNKYSDTYCFIEIADFIQNDVRFFIVCAYRIFLFELRKVIKLKGIHIRVCTKESHCTFTVSAA